MTADASDRTAATGLVLAGLSAASFGLSGPLARCLLDVGWSPGAVVLARIAIAALVVAPFAVHALWGRWHLLRDNARLVAVYGVVPVAATQFAYFSAVAEMDVAPALLIEYTAPAAVVAWLWLRNGERPSRMTLAGAGVATLGLVLVLDLLSGAGLAPGGVAWALLAMSGAAVYFVMSADTSSGGVRPGTLAVVMMTSNPVSAAASSACWAACSSAFIARAYPPSPAPAVMDEVRNCAPSDST